MWEGQTDEATHWLAQSLAQEANPGIIIIYEVVRLFVAAHLATAQQQYQRAALLVGLAEQANSHIHHAYAGLLRTQTDAALPAHPTFLCINHTLFVILRNLSPSLYSLLLCYNHSLRNFTRLTYRASMLRRSEHVRS